MAWTDRNLHDPGVSVLELLIYSIAGCWIGWLVVRRRKGKLERLK